ncbi:MAG: tRNA (adenosine(37)-N6)-threonylcarbamoyltransferase complex transferase subunit TsaD [Sedimentisphaerales bacterium]|nr:tRNA (adenosine(37)-N6)-threonylcarbamoyltransferase complex transferase subunit TsaD [Sedimentisphaerales bacterium]MBN2843004.1 tRNA (adenosine(37)-N6)-threonylcarbamoyltransferase complex transferase subunit TsaD [Sedimentisphaerales bacterium]
MSDKIILGIESSCDETAAAVVANGHQVLSSVLNSQVKLHEKYGGVVPEIAARAHIECIIPLIKEAIAKAGIEPERLDAIAVANCPGLTPALLIGVTAAKSLAWAWEKPLIAVNHIHCHLHSVMLDESAECFPAVALVVSGGHTSLYDCKSPMEMELLGQTIDDAAGEAFDKAAAILKLPYPGGPSIQKAAENGNPKAVRFPRTMLGPDSLDFSFSGIKTSVLYHCKGQNMLGENNAEQMSQQEIADIAASFQEAVVEVLVKKTIRAAKLTGHKYVLLGGGVAANSVLRDRLDQVCCSNKLKLVVSQKKYCTDNAAMVAGLAYYKLQAGLTSDFSLEPVSTQRKKHK